MKYNGTDFNEEVVLRMSRKEFLVRGRLGNKLTEEQANEAYDLIMKKNGKDENGRQLTTSPERTRPTKANAGVDDPNKGSTAERTTGPDDPRY